MLKERVLIGDLCTLYICPSPAWGTIERKALEDCLYFKTIGGTPVLFCLKDSFLDREAEKQDIERVYSTGKIGLRHYLGLKQILSKRTVDIVHCYDLVCSWSVCFLLGHYLKIPLILTLNEVFTKKYKSPWRRLLFSRVDTVLTFGQATRGYVLENLPISARKVLVLGMGIDEASFVRKDLPTFSAERTFRVGTYIPRHCEDLSLVQPLLYALFSLKKELTGPRKFQFWLLTDRNWDEFVLYQGIKREVQKLGLESFLLFGSGPSLTTLIRPLDLYLSMDAGEPMCECEVFALVHSIPLLLPRTLSRQELLRVGKCLGESYQPGDARELKGKILKILEQYPEYFADCERSQARIIKKHSLQRYSELLYFQYEKLHAQRLRLRKRRRLGSLWRGLEKN